MNNHNKVTQISESEVPEFDSGSEKPEIAKKIEAFDIKNLTPENIEFMSRTIQDYFRENYPVQPELVDQLPERLTILGASEFVEKQIELSGRRDRSVRGFYDSSVNKMFLNKDAFEDSEDLFHAMVHESLHFTSIGAGAGINSGFIAPRRFWESDDLLSQLKGGLTVVREGTTELITMNALGNMGFQISNYQPYQSERLIMDAIWSYFSPRYVKHVYFEVPVENLRVHIEKLFASDEERSENSVDGSNGIFADYLCRFQALIDGTNETLEGWQEDESRKMGVLDETYDIVWEYIKRDMEVNRGDSRNLEKYNEKLRRILRSWIKIMD